MEWSGPYRHGLGGGVWLKGAHVPDQYLQPPAVTSYDYDVLVTAPETVWVLSRADSYVVGLAVSLTEAEPPPPQPTRELAQLHPLEPLTARIYTQTSTVEFSEPAKLLVGAIERIDYSDMENPEELKALAIPPGTYNVSASLWHYDTDESSADPSNADNLPVQVRLSFWPQARTSNEVSRLRTRDARRS